MKKDDLVLYNSSLGTDTSKMLPCRIIEVLPNEMVKIQLFPDQKDANSFLDVPLTKIYQKPDISS